MLRKFPTLGLGKVCDFAFKFSFRLLQKKTFLISDTLHVGSFLPSNFK